MGLLNDKRYGNRWIRNRYTVAPFVVTFLLIFICSWPLLVSDNDTLLTKIGTMTSIGGILLATYITVWLINQNRNRGIGENYFYKVKLLGEIQSMLHDVNHVLPKIIREQNSEKLDGTKITNLQKSGMESFKHDKHRIELINSNTFVPADIRADVQMLLENVIKPIEFPSAIPDVVESTLLSRLDKVIDSEYFTKNQDDHVQKMLKDVQEWRQKIMDSANRRTP